jgi:hypothetical protein
MTAARACLRLHELTYVQGWRAAPSPEAAFGTLLHHGLESWWLAAQDGHDGDARLAAALDAVCQGEADPFDLARASALLVGYTARWESEPLDVLSVEAEFSTPLVNPATGAASKTWRLAGKIDAIVRDASGRVLIVEHKTSGEDISPGSDYWRRLAMNAQVSVYYDGARSLGFDVEGCLYDVIGKPKLRPKLATPEESRRYTKSGALDSRQRTTDETPDEFAARLGEEIAANPDEYFRRGDVPRTERDLEEARADAWQTALLIHGVERSGHAPRNPDACLRYGRTCAFLDVCAGQAAIDSGRFVRLETPHPELSGAAIATRSREETPDGNPAAA